MVKSPLAIRKPTEPRALGEAEDYPALSGYTRFPQQDNSDSAHQRLYEYWRAARKHLGIIIGIVTLSTILAATYMARKPDIFEARSRVQVDLENTSPGLGSLRGGSVIFNAPSFDPAYFNTQLEILTSAGLLGRVAKTLDLEHNQAFVNPGGSHSRSTWQNLRRMVGLGVNKDDEKKTLDMERVEIKSEGATVPTADDLVEVNRLAPYVSLLQSNLTVKPIGETRLIELRYRGTDPQLSAKILNAIADTFKLQNLEKKSDDSNNASDFLQRRIAELQSDIRRGEENLINYGKSREILSLDGSQNIVAERLAALNQQLLVAGNDRKTAEAAYRAALAPNAVEAAINAGGGGNSLGATLESELATLRQKRAQLLVRYTEEFPAVKEIDEQIAVIEKQSKQSRTRAGTTLITNLETAYRQALAKEQVLRADFARQRAETLTQNESAITYRIIQQETATNKELLDGLLQKQKENDVVIAGTPNNVRVVDYAAIPGSPVGPRRLQTVFFVFVIALAFGVGLSRYLEFLDNTIQTTDDVTGMLRLPALAVIPVMGSSAKRRLLQGVTTALQRREEAGAELLINNGDPRSPLAEAYRQLRTSILLSSAGGAPQTLLVTSGQPSEGKTTTAINTAQILARITPKVLIVDADMRRPRLHQIFGVSNQRGLSTILASETGEAEILSMIEQIEDNELYVLPSGPIPPNPAELLGSEQMNRLMDTLRGTFTHIVIDSPPIATFTDGVLISTMVDGVLLVVHSGVALKNVVLRSRDMLQDVGARIFGVVLNKVNVREQGYYYQGYYNRQHYYSDVESAIEEPGTTLRN